MKFNGIDPCSLHPGISIAKEIPPGTVTSKLETLSGSTEEVIVGRTIKQAEYVVRINIAGKYRAQAWQIRKLLAGWARGTDVATCPLEPTHWRTVQYDAILKEISPPEFTFGYGVIDVVFAIPRPIAMDTMLRHGIGTSGSTQTIVSVEGTSYARPMITVYAKESSDLTVEVDGMTHFGICGGIAEGERVEITTTTPKVRIRDASGVWYDANERVDYTITNMQALAESFKPGSRTVSCKDADRIDLQWRDEWL